MMSQVLRHFLYIVLVVLTACAGAPHKQNESLSSGPSAPALDSSSYLSARLADQPSPEQCPSSDKSWRKESLRNLIKLAGICAQLNQFDRLEKIGDHLAQKFSLQPWGAYFLSIAAEQRKDYGRALWMADLAIKKSPRTAMFYYQKGRIYWNLGEYSNAVSSYELALRENSKFSDAHLFLGQLYYRDQDFKKSVFHFSRVVELEPNNAQAVVELAEAKIALGRPADAVPLYEKAINMSPRNVEYKFKLAGLYENVRKDYAQALGIYRKLKTMIAETRTPAEEIPLDLNEKIRHLEGLVQSAGGETKKISKSNTVRMGKAKK